MAKGKKWIVTTSGDRSINEVEDELKKQGFKVDEVFGEIGSIIGEGDEDVIKKARDISGITDVSPDEPIDIGPPGSDDTW